jgi:nucleoside-diphosphate-sugar epimerase
MRIVVLGAGGGVGGWICEVAADSGSVELLACVRNWASAVRLARRGIDLAQCDIAKPDEVARCIEGADAVINATMLPPAQEPDLVEQLYKVCAKAGVARFVQLSSAVVYGERTGDVDESAELAPIGGYAQAKVEMEARIMRAARDGGPQLFILRPSIVYGPFSSAWTVRYAQRIISGKWQSLGSAGQGLCNLVHAQDVARCALACASNEAGVSGAHVFNLNGPDKVTWNDYIECFGDALGVADRSAPGALSFRFNVLAGEGMRNGGKYLKDNLNGLFSALTQAKGTVGGAVGGAKVIGALYPSLEECRLLTRRAYYPAANLARVLNFQPATSMADGVAQSAHWCKVHGVV